MLLHQLITQLKCALVSLVPQANIKIYWGATPSVRERTPPFADCTPCQGRHNLTLPDATRRVGVARVCTPASISFCFCPSRCDSILTPYTFISDGAACVRLRECVYLYLSWVSCSKSILLPDTTRCDGVARACIVATSVYCLFYRCTLLNCVIIWPY